MHDLGKFLRSVFACQNQVRLIYGGLHAHRVRSPGQAVNVIIEAWRSRALGGVLPETDFCDELVDRRFLQAIRADVIRVGNARHIAKRFPIRRTIDHIRRVR